MAYIRGAYIRDFMVWYHCFAMQKSVYEPPQLFMTIFKNVSLISGSNTLYKEYFTVAGYIM